MTLNFLHRDDAHELLQFRPAPAQGRIATGIKVSTVALYSDVTETGSFSCSDEMLNQLP